jgi:hypothetical protein
MLNMKIFSTNTCYVPQNLQSIMDSKLEVPAEQGGMTNTQVEHIWHSIEQLYRTGNYPLISVCLRRKGHIILNRSLGYAQGNSTHGLAKNALIANTIPSVTIFLNMHKMVNVVLRFFISCHIVAEFHALKWK